MGTPLRVRCHKAESIQHPVLVCVAHRCLLRPSFNDFKYTGGVGAGFAGQLAEHPAFGIDSDGEAPIQAPARRTLGDFLGSPADMEVCAEALVASSDSTSQSPISNCVSTDYLVTRSYSRDIAHIVISLKTQRRAPHKEPSSAWEDRPHSPHPWFVQDKLFRSWAVA